MRASLPPRAIASPSAFVGRWATWPWSALLLGMLWLAVPSRANEREVVAERREDACSVQPAGEHVREPLGGAHASVELEEDFALPATDTSEEEVELGSGSPRCDVEAWPRVPARLGAALRAVPRRARGSERQLPVRGPPRD